MKVIAVTGGAQGIGRVIFLHFADHGYAVSIAGPADDANAEVSALLRSAARRH